MTEVEPLPPTSRLWELPNVIITPHVGAQSRTRYDDATRLFCENLQRYSARRADVECGRQVTRLSAHEGS